jgi:O-antigen/teichoic acid export membrane protein
MDSSASSRAIARPTLVILAGSCAAALTSFAVRWAMARGLPPAGFGRVTLGIAIASAAGGVATLGLGSAVARRVALLLAHERPAAARSTARTALATAAASGLLAAALLVAAAPAAERADLAALLWVLAPVTAALAIGGALVGISRGFGDTGGRALLRDTLGGALRLAGVAAGLRAGAGAVGAALGYAAGTAVAEAALGAYAVSRGWLSDRAHARPRGSDPCPGGEADGIAAAPPLGAVVGTGLDPGAGPGAVAAPRPGAAGLDRELLRSLPPFAAGTVLAQAGQWFDVLLLGALAGAGEVGVYGVARGVGRALELASEAAGHRFLPAATAAHARQSPAALAAVYRRTRNLVLALLWPAAAVCLFVPSAVVRELFGDRYGGAGPALALLTAGLLVSVALGYNDGVLVACGRAGAVSRRAAAGLGLGVAVTLLAAPSRGGLGAAAGWAAMTVCQNLLWARRLWVEARLAPWDREQLWSAFGTAAPALVVAAAVRAAAWSDAAAAVAIATAAAAGSAGALWRGWAGPRTER